MDRPWLMRAVLLSRVVTLGAEMVLTSPVFSSADSRRFRLSAPPADPKTKPNAPPDPAPTAAGRLTAKFGTVLMPEALAEPWSAPPVTRAVLGKTSPVALFVLAEAWALPPHCTPMDRVKV